MLKSVNWKYTIGEILIVIVGISIAFGLNKCSDNTRDKARKAEYVESLRSDLAAERAHLADNIVEFDQRIATIRAIMPAMYSPESAVDSLASKIFGLATIVHFEPHDITYRTLINSADLGLFHDFDIRRQLENHYTSYHRLLQTDYERQSKIHENYLGDFMINEIDYDALRQGDLSFARKPLLRNIIQSLYGTYAMAMATSETGMAHCDSLIAALQAAYR